MKNRGHRTTCKDTADAVKVDSTALTRTRVGGYIGEQARASIVNEHYNWMLGRCQYILGNEADAQDAAQEAALRIYHSLPNFQGRSSLKTWINQIAKNECVNLIRKRQRNMQTYQLIALVELQEQTQTQLQLEHAATEPVPVENLHRAIGVLQEDHREILLLRFFSELPLAEIGSLLGISLSATKMRLYRAIAAVRDAFQASNCAPLSAS